MEEAPRPELLRMRPSLNALTRLERGEVDPRVSIVEAVQKATQKAGVEFVSADDSKGEGVRLARP
jgi:predicted transcriptional regulator